MDHEEGQAMRIIETRCPADNIVPAPADLGAAVEILRQEIEFMEKSPDLPPCLDSLRRVQEFLVNLWVKS